MLTYKKEFVCNNTSVTAIVGEDGSLTLDGFNEEYEDTLVALGAKRSICKKLVDEWNDSRQIAITEYLADDIRAIVSTAADAVERASFVYSKRFIKKPENNERFKSFSAITRAISYARQIVHVRTRHKRVQWSSFSPNTSDIRSDMNLLFESEGELSRDRGHKNKRMVSLMNLYLAAGHLCQSIVRIGAVEANLNSDLDDPGDPDGWWDFIAQRAANTMHHSAWSLSFGSGEQLGISYDSAIDWIVGRFVLGMNSLEAGREWPALEPL